MSANNRRVILQILKYIINYFFFFQAEDGIRDVAVTGVQTCALPILNRGFDEKHNFLFIESPVYAREIDQGTQKQTGADEKHKGKRDLRDDQRTGKTAAHAQRSGTSPRLKSVGEVNVRGAQRGQRAKKKCSAKRDQKSESKETHIRRDVERERLRSGRDPYQDSPAGP